MVRKLKESVYSVTYCYDDEWSGSGCSEEDFEGSWLELQDYISRLKANGCYNINASFLYDDDDEYDESVQGRKGRTLKEIRSLIFEDVAGGPGAVIAQKALKMLEPYKRQLELEKDNLKPVRYKKWKEKLKDAENFYLGVAEDYNRLLPDIKLSPDDVLLHIGTGKCWSDDIDTWSRNFTTEGIIIPYILSDGNNWVSCAESREDHSLHVYIGEKPEGMMWGGNVYFYNPEDAKKFATKYSLEGVKPEKLVRTNRFSKNLVRTLSGGGLFNIGRKTVVRQDGLIFVLLVYTEGNNVLPYKVDIIDTRPEDQRGGIQNKRGPGFKSSVINKIVSKYHTEAPSISDAGDDYANASYEFKIGDKEVRLVRYERGPSSNRAKYCVEIGIYDNSTNEELYDDLLYLDEYDSVEEQFNYVLKIIDEYVG